MRVMVVDDEPGIRLLVGTVVREAGHECLEAAGGHEALALFGRERPDLVVLDVMMPKMDGYEVCRRIREVDANVPVLFLSARGDIVDKRMGFTTGGDDYLVKPFDEEELVMRVEALARRAGRTGADARARKRLEAGGIVLDLLRHQVTKDGTAVALTPKEFQLLYELAAHPGQVMGKDELIERVWGPEYLDEGINIAMYVKNLRKKIEDDPAEPVYLRTVWGVGYAFGE